MDSRNRGTLLYLFAYQTKKSIERGQVSLDNFQITHTTILHIDHVAFHVKDFFIPMTRQGTLVDMKEVLDNSNLAVTNSIFG